MRHDDRKTATVCGIAGLLLCAIALLVGGGTREALLAWLAAFAFVAGLPLGALCLALVLRIVPGAWRSALEPEADGLAFTMPLLLLLFPPLLIGLSHVYPWAGDMALTGFKAIYLTPLFFILRSVAILIGATLIAVLLAARPNGGGGLATVGLIAFVLLHNLICVDWLLSLDPDFHSSGFGLYVLSSQVLSAFCVIVLMRLLGGSDANAGIIGALLLTLLLLWTYFAFMQYFITWSGNLPPGVTWYRRRGEGGWAIVEYLIALSRLLPCLLLFFPPLQRSQFWLTLLAVAVLTGSLLENAWLVLPAADRITTLSILSLVFALAGMLLLLPVGRLGVRAMTPWLTPRRSVA